MDRIRDLRPYGSPLTPSDPNPLTLRLLSNAAAGRNACLIWTGGIDRGGYGKIRISGVLTVTHRAAYQAMVGPIPPGMQIDHVCHSQATDCDGGDSCIHRRCINPNHLEPVTPRENSRRTNKARKTHCIHGHPFDEANTQIRPNGTRRCRKCHAKQSSRANRRTTTAVTR